MRKRDWFIAALLGFGLAFWVWTNSQDRKHEQQRNKTTLHQQQIASAKALRRQQIRFAKTARENQVAACQRGNPLREVVFSAILAAAETADNAEGRSRYREQIKKLTEVPFSNEDGTIRCAVAVPPTDITGLTITAPIKTKVPQTKNSKNGTKSFKLPGRGSPSEATQDSPAATSPAPSSPGESESTSHSPGKTKHHEPPKQHQPSPAPEHPSGVSTPESGGGSPPAIAPEASTGTPATGSEVATGEGSTGIEGTPPAIPSHSGLEEVVGGTVHTVEEVTEPVTKPLCEVGLAGIKVCLR